MSMWAWDISVTIIIINSIIIYLVLQYVTSISESQIKSKTYTLIVTRLKMHVTGGIMQIECTWNRIMSFVICGTCLGSAD